MRIVAGSVPKPHPGWMKPLARMGYGARGAVYIVIAFFAAVAAVSGGETQDSRGALDVLLQNPAGGVLAVLLIIGLAGHSVWRFVQSLLDTDDHGFSAKGLAVRGGLLVSGVTYAVLTVYTWSLWRGVAAGDGGGGAAAEFLSGIVGARPAAWLLAAIFLIVACAHVTKAVTKGYRKHIDVPARLEGVLDPVARAGLLARGATFAVIALLFVTRGVTGGSGSGETPGLGDALDYVTALPFGRLLLGFVAVGLCGFALYSFIEAAWRKVNVEDASVRRQMR